MRISYKGDYALKAVLDLALHYGSELVTGHDLALHIDAPVKFLEQVLLDLKKGGFIESKRGNIGGYMLSRSPDQITVGDIVRYIDGPVEPIACLSEKYKNCTDIRKCRFRKIWDQVNEATLKIIDNVNFETLASEVKQETAILNYSI
jgi:Rrf2 family protein